MGALDYDMVRVLWTLIQAFPIRLVAVYVVFHDPLWMSVVDACTQLCPTSVRLRTRSIQGKDEKFAIGRRWYVRLI
jgi:hypothetical protein